MLRILVTFGLHRLILLAVALFMVHFSSAQKPVSKPGVQVKQPSLWSRFMKQVSERPEMQSLIQQGSRPQYYRWEAPPDPFLMLHRMLRHYVGTAPMNSILFLSNLFFLMFLMELYIVLSRMVPPGKAAKAATLVILLPTSFEMSLGSSFSLFCFVFMAAIARALDGRWLLSGLLFAVGVLIDPQTLLLLPLLGATFAYFQKSLYLSLVMRRAVLFLTPVLAGLIWNRQALSGIFDRLGDSSFFYVFQLFSSGAGRDFLHSPLGTTVVLVVLAAGGVAAFLHNSSIVHKVTPIYTFFYLLFTAPIETITSYAPLAGLCLEGIALVSGTPAMWTVQAALMGLGMFEVAWAFRVV